MSEHAQALMISTRVHAIFGYTLMLAGVTRIIEISFIVPKYSPEAPVVQDDSHSEHTLNDGSSSTTTSAQAVKTFRHLPPYVRACISVDVRLCTYSSLSLFSFLSLLGT